MKSGWYIFTFSADTSFPKYEVGLWRKEHKNRYWENVLQHQLLQHLRQAFKQSQRHKRVPGLRLLVQVSDHSKSSNLSRSSWGLHHNVVTSLTLAVSQLVLTLSPARFHSLPACGSQWPSSAGSHGHGQAGKHIWFPVGREQGVILASGTVQIGF